MQSGGEKRAMEHFQFIKSTDRKSLHAQIKALVTKAQEVTAEDLQDRSLRLKGILEQEDKIYEEEFANKVKTRIDEDIRARKEHLHAIKEEHDKRHKQFLNEKRVQQVMESSYEIRQALRQEDLKNTKICQEEQIMENLRRKRRGCETENYWIALNERRWKEFDCAAQYEVDKRKQMKKQMCHVLKLQVDEAEEKRQQIRDEKQEEADQLTKLLEEIRLEQFEEDHRPSSGEKEKYRDELLAEIDRRKAERDAEWLAAKEEHAAFIRETQRLEKEAKISIEQRKRELNRATHEYIAYVRRMRALELGIEKMMDDRTKDLYHVDSCTKSNITEAMRRKGEEAARCHAILKRQICEEAERRLRWEAEAHEDKIIENRFVHPPVTREMVLAKSRQHRQDLDAQIVEMKRVQLEEEKRFEQQLQKAIDDPEVCDQLAVEYVRDGTDYLAPHPNWKIYSCPHNQYVDKAPMAPSHLSARIQDASLEKCPCPDIARRHCAFMATQGTLADVPRKPKVCAQQPTLDVPPEGRMLQPDTTDPKSCYCLPYQRGHINLHQK